MDSPTLPSTPESGKRASYDGGKRKRGSNIHMAVATLGDLLALHVTPASAEDRGEVERLAHTAQAVTNDIIELAWVDQGYTGGRAAAAKQGIALEVVKLQTWLRPLAMTLGCRTANCLSDPLPTPRQRLHALR